MAPLGAEAGVPIDLRESLAGNLDFVGAAGTFRADPNNVDACSRNNSSTVTVSGIPGTAQIRAAYLYWGGSGSTVDDRVRLLTPAQNSGVRADRTFTESFTFGATTYDFFGGFADITAMVDAGRNGNYRLSRLNFDTGAPYCGVQAVIGGWSMVVVYEDAGEPFRVVNLFDGLQFFRASQVTLTPDNFIVPASPIDGKLAHITWEGDEGNSASLGGFSEQLAFEGTVLTDGLNPSNNQFNSTANFVPTNTLYGVDFDIYDISPLLSAGQTSGTSTYRSGGDLVLLAAEVFSVTNTPVADLSVDKSHSGDFTIGFEGDYSIAVANAGPMAETGPIVVDDVLPAGLSFVSATGSGWNCTNPSAGTMQCSHPGPLAVGASLPSIALRVGVDSGAPSSVTNTASVSGALFDNVAANDSDDDLTLLLTPPNLVIVKSVSVLDDPINGSTNPKAIPGANVIYTISITNQGEAQVDSDTLVLEDSLPAELELFVDPLGNGTCNNAAAPVTCTDGSPASGVTLDFGGLADASDGIEFDDGSLLFTHVPTADADGFDPSVAAIRVRPDGALLGSSSGDPGFELRFRMRVR